MSNAPFRLFLTVAALSALAALAQPAAARDRPGTPTAEKAYACGDSLKRQPAICAEVDNTASEPVYFETQVTLAGAPVEPGALGGTVDCLTNTPRLSDEEKEKYTCSRITGVCEHPPASRLAGSHRCEAAKSLSGRSFARTAGAVATMKTGAFDREAGRGVAPQGIIIRDVAPLSEYCLRFRTRRVSDQVVSAQWSNWACAQARSLPARPTAPYKPSATFVAASWAGNSDSKPLPNRVILRWEAGLRVGWYVVRGKRFDLREAKYQETIEVPAPVLAAGGETVEFCAHNISGKACTTVLYTPVPSYLTKHSPATDAIRAQSPQLPLRSGATDAIRAQSPQLPPRSSAAEAIKAVVPAAPPVPAPLPRPSPLQPLQVVPTRSSDTLTPTRGSLSASVFAGTARPVVQAPAPAPAPVPVPAPAPAQVGSPFSVGCQLGFVHRMATSGDTACVTQVSRKRTNTENVTAAHRVQPGGRERGPRACIAGYVWRQAVPGDYVCVRPAILALVAEENRLAASRAR
ncbi:MAG: hypothetical protein ABI699_10040 [Caldimonas sp.]